MGEVLQFYYHQVNIPSDLHLVSFIGSLSDDHHVNYKELSHSIGFVCYM